MAALAVSVLVSAVTIASAQDEAVLLRFKGEVGQKARYSNLADISLSFQGEKLAMEEKSTSESEVIEVRSNGEVVVKSKSLSSETKIAGERLPSEGPSGEYTQTTYAPNGAIVKYEVFGGEPDDPNVALQGRLARATTVVFSDKPVGVGAKWTIDIAGDAKVGSRNAKADFTLEAFEDLKNVRVAKIKMVFAEKSGTPAISATSTHWVEVESGDTVKSESKVTGAEIDLGGAMAPVEAKVSAERISGGLIQLSTNAPEGELEDTDSIDAKVKEFEKLDGLFPLYRKVDAGRETLYMEISESQLGQLVMLQTTAGTGIGDGRITAGDPINDLVFKFVETPNNRIVMQVPNLGFRAGSNAEMERSINKSFPDAVVESFSIEARQKDRESLLIDVSNFFKGDISRVGELLQGGGNPFAPSAGGAYSPDRENSYVKTLKNFPENLYVETQYNFVGRGGGGGGLAALLAGESSTTADDRSILIRLNYNMYMLPVDNGYQPRYADSRVGYFTVDYQSFEQPTALDQAKQMILRWHLQKQDPSAEVSEPVEPIVFWVDNAVPSEYREAVIAGIEVWNSAFEKIGYKNAVVAKQMPVDAEFDHADMRYNTVRWVSSPENAYAIALFRANPLTGQILNGSVTIDGNIVRAFATEYGNFVRPEAWQEKLKKDMAQICDDPRKCKLMSHAKLNVSSGMLANSMMQVISRDDYIRQFITWVVSHEVGHMMGLRHNFVASTLLDLKELGDKSKVATESTSSSVMDYVAFNPSALNTGARFYGDKLGRYDLWAIEYGYKEFPGKNEDEERFDLARIASRCNEPGLAYLSDEFADGIDPYVTRFDLGKDPVAYWSTMGNLSMDLIKKLDQHSPKNGESFYRFTQEFNTLLNNYARSSVELTRFIGGVRRNPNYKGDAGEQMPIQPISADDQRAALQQTMKQTFSEQAFNIPPKYYQMLTGNPKAGFLESMMAGMDDYPMLDTLSGIQRAVLSSLMSPDTLNRVINNDFESGTGQTVNLVEVMQSIKVAIWAETSDGRRVTPLRRNLQRAHAEMLADIVMRKRAYPSEVRTVALVQLRQMRAEIAKASGMAKDTMTQYHWIETVDALDKALNAMPTIGGGAQAGPSLLELLMGGSKKIGGKN